MFRGVAGPGILKPEKLLCSILEVYIGIMEKKMETTEVYWCDVGIMEKQMETTIVCWGSIGIMEKKMETTT